MFGKLKQALGIGTIKVELQIPPTAQKGGGALPCTIRLTAQNDQSVQDITIRFVERYSTGRGSEKKTREFELGQIKLPAVFEMKSGDVKDITFSLPYQVLKSKNDKLKEHGGAVGALGKLASMADAESSEYFVNAMVSVKGVALSPSDRKNIVLT